MTVGSLFSGIGLLDYGLHLAGFEHAWLCEREPDRRAVLGLRFPGVPVYDNVRAVGAEAARPDVIAGGFPCKGISSAGPRTGFGHPETALWREQFRVIRELRPRYVIVENVADLLTLHRGELFGEVLGGLASCGYDTEWDCFPAAAFGAPHGRDRVFVTAAANPDRELRQARRAEARSERARWSSPRGGAGAPTDADEDGRSRLARAAPGRDALHGDERDDANGRGVRVGWGPYEPAVRRWEGIVGRVSPEPLLRRVDDGGARRVERSRLSALGDGVLVQAGQFVGRRLMEYEAARRAA